MRLLNTLYFFVLAYLFSLFSCQGNSEDIPTSPGAEKESILFTLKLAGETTTRAFTDNTLESLTVLFFKKDGSDYKYHSKQTVSTYTTPQPEIYTYKLDYPSGGSPTDNWAMAFIGNPDIDSSFSPTTADLMSDVLPVLITNMGDPNVRYRVGTTNVYKLPMYGFTDDITLIYSGVQEVSTVTDPITLTRMLAKFTVTSHINVTNPLVIESAKLINVRRQGIIYHKGTRFDPLFTIPSFTSAKVDYDVYTLSGTLPTGTTLQEIEFYSFETENPRKNPGTPLEDYFNTYEAFEQDKGNGYTYIELTADNGNTYALSIPRVSPYPNYTVFSEYLGDITRNRHYKFTIKGISETKFIDAYVEVIEWTPCKIDVDL